MTIEIGKLAPDFTLQASNGQTVRLADFRGQNVLLYFYPKDLTPACTTQACDLRDRTEQFNVANTIILGISMDTVAYHQKFIAKYNLPFLLLADEDHHVAELYQVWQLKKLYGREYMGIERSTFLINPQGILVKEWRKIRVKGHADDALSFLSQAKSKL